MTAYQVLPPLSSDDLAALKADIETRGVLVPVEYDEDGNILDGHHRVQICKELGIRKWPKVVRKGMTDAEKRTHARQLNLARRHLDQAARRKLIEQELLDRPERSNRSVAADLGVSHPTVSAVREKMVSTGKSFQLDKTVGVDGKARPARPESPKRSVVLDPEFQAEAEAAARDIEIERDERIATSGAGVLADENEKLTKQVSMLTRRISGLLEEVSSLTQKVKIWKERALGAGWKGRPNA